MTQGEKKNVRYNSPCMPSYKRETFAIIKVLFGIILNYLLWGEKKDNFFHIFALKYAYTLRIQMI